MNDEQNAVVFAGIFKQTIQNILSRVKAWVSSCPDPYTPLLISAINTKSKEKLNQKGYDILDYYFDQVNFCVWPRFTEIYDHLILPFSHPNYQQVLALETELGLEIYYGPVVTFLRAVRSFERPQMTMVFTIYRDAAALLPPALFTILLSFYPIPVVFLVNACFALICAILSLKLPRSL